MYFACALQRTVDRNSSINLHTSSSGSNGNGSVAAKPFSYSCAKFIQHGSSRGSLSGDKQKSTAAAKNCYLMQ
jgi:hypothetical protein